MYNFITHNWTVKIICLIIAIIFWAYISVQGAKTDNLPGDVALELKNVPEGLVAIIDTDRIEVNIAAKKNVWSEISTDSITASIDLKNLSIGTHEVNVIIESKIKNIEIINYTPKKVLVRLDTKVVKTVPVSVKIEGNAKEGLSPGVASILPDKVEITGAKSIVEKILEATAIIKLNGETEDINKKIKLVALNSENELIKGINFNPIDVDVNVPIIKAETSKTVGIKTVFDGNVAEGFWISNIKTNPSDITITGQANLLKSINYIETKPININNISFDISKEIELNIPPGVTVLDKINKIIVSIILSSSDTTKNIQAEISYNNLSNNLKINSVDPQIVMIEISGSINELSNINSKSIKLNIDLSNNFSAGNYSIELNNGMISVPENINVINIVPNSIKIDIGNK